MNTNAKSNLHSSPVNFGLGGDDLSPVQSPKPPTDAGSTNNNRKKANETINSNMSSLKSNANKITAKSRSKSVGTSLSKNIKFEEPLPVVIYKDTP